MESCQRIKHTTSPVSISQKSTTSLEVEKCQGNDTREELVREFPSVFSKQRTDDIRLCVDLSKLDMYMHKV